jgi:hypothetical protein
VRLSVETKDARVFFLSLSLSFVLGGDVADLQIYREGKHICGLDLDVTRKRSFSWFGCGGFGDGKRGSGHWRGCVLFPAMFCNRWKDRFF